MTLRIRKSGQRLFRFHEAGATVVRAGAEAARISTLLWYPAGRYAGPAFENAVLRNWCYLDSNRRPNAARAAMHRQSTENSPGGAQGSFAAGLCSHGGADTARSAATRAGDPRVFERRPGPTGSALARPQTDLYRKPLRT